MSDLRFDTHYTRDEARALLPQIRQWLQRLLELRGEVEKADQRLVSLMTPGRDVGGKLVNSWVRLMVELQEVLLEFYRREIQIKDVERGLIDFPAIIAGKEVFLCWEQDEEDIEYWHDLDAGFVGRQPL
jgi:hypothetical protein